MRGQRKLTCTNIKRICMSSFIKCPSLRCCRKFKNRLFKPNREKKILIEKNQTDTE